MKKVVIHSDGGCQGNPGPGGWAATLSYEGRHKEISGGAPATTNNRMELQAALEALSVLKEPCEVDFYTDSQYLRKGVTEWIFNWKRNGWMTKAKQPVKNADLWKSLDQLVHRHKVKWHWLKGHAGHAGNERCDGLATTEIEKIRKQYTRAQLKELVREFAASQEPSATAVPGLFGS